MLHEETGVDSDENGRGKVAQESQHLTCRVGIIDGSLLGKRTGARLADSWNDARRCIQYEQAVGERDEDGGRDSAENGGNNVESCVDNRRQKRHRVHQGCVRCHDNGRQRRELSDLRGRGDLFHRVRWLIVREDLVDAEHDIGEEERAFDWIAATTSNPPGTQNDGACDRDSNQGGIDVGDFGELQNTPEEVNRAGDNCSGQDQEADLRQGLVFIATSMGKPKRKTYHPAIAASTSVDKPTGNLPSSLDHQ